MHKVLQRLQLPRAARVVTVAGTNGKGSTVAILEALYSAMGRRVACYTSPHVIRFNERMRVAGQDLADAEIVSALQIVEAARGDTPLTFFEFGTLAAFVAFAAANADVHILEIGLGGRLDAVNALDPDGAIICNVSLDHCAWLGNDVETIAREKAGVMREAIPVVFGAAKVPASVLEIAATTGAELLVADRDFHADSHGPASDSQWSFTYRDQAPLVLKKPSLTGAFQLHNAAGALALFFALEGSRSLAPKAISAALSSLRVSGRMQSLYTDRHWLLDVAHNPASAEVLGLELASRNLGGKLVAVVGVLADKDLAGMLKPLLPLVDAWVAVTPHGPRALQARELAGSIAALGDTPCWIAESIDAGLTIASRIAGSDDLILVTGSFYTVGPALEKLGSEAGHGVGYTRGAANQQEKG
ncbi:MAG: folylpolyglutamate synthase/dihydrofolate synthase family protein [Woeseia sp.]